MTISIFINLKYIFLLALMVTTTEVQSFFNLAPTNAKTGAVKNTIPDNQMHSVFASILKLRIRHDFMSGIPGGKLRIGR
jgi:hypothetical protein